MKHVFSIIIMGLSFSLSGQNLPWMHLALDSISSSRLELSSELELGSSGMSNHVFKKLAFGGRLDRELLSEMSENMSEFSSAGAYLDTRFRYSATPDSIKFKRHKSLFLEFGNVTTLNSEFSSGLFHLAFLGNADKLGETLNLGPSDLSFLWFQYAGLGISNNKNGNYASFNLINIQSSIRLGIGNSSLYTGESAETLTLNYDGNLLRSDTLRGEFLNTSGIGVSLNGRYSFCLNKKQDVFSVELRNVGMAVLSNKTSVISADSTLTFSGIDLNELISSDDYLSSITISDSISYERSSGEEQVVLPLDINARYMHKINSSDFIGISLRKFGLSAHRLDAGFDYIHKENEYVSYSIGLSHGGFNKNLRLRLGAHLTYKNWMLYANTNHGLGLFLNKAKGFSLVFGIQRKFNKNS